MSISQITTVKGRKAEVKKNLDKWLSSGVDQVVLVDYNCPERTGVELLKSEIAKDPRLSILLLGPQAAGPFYNHGRARNIGVQCARHETLVFLDADCIATPGYLEAVNAAFEDGADVFTTVAQKNGKLDVAAFEALPASWTVDGQLAIRNAVYYDVNGYDETQEGWGGETYDLLLRAEARGARFEFVPSDSKWMWLRHVAHNDEIRDRYQPQRFHGQEGSKEEAYAKAVKYFTARRKQTFRAQPGRRFGFEGSNPFVRFFRGGIEYAFRPCEDD